jgi:HEAT repeat protein
VVKKRREGVEEIPFILRDLKCGDWIIRQEAVGRIGRIKDPAVLSELLHLLPKEKWYIREAVAAGIRSINNPALSGPLQHGLAFGDDCIRNACARALGIMRCRDAEDLLEKAVEDPDSRVRKTARTSLELIRECDPKTPDPMNPVPR